MPVSIPPIIFIAPSVAADQAAKTVEARLVVPDLDAIAVAAKALGLDLPKIAEAVRKAGTAFAGGTILELASTDVILGRDPGNFYCEHAFFVGQIEAKRPDAHVRANVFGEPLVGFLHVPSDEYTHDALEPGSPLPYALLERHAETIEVVSLAVRSYFDDAALTAPGDVRILLTGYLTWSGVHNNPTGEFVSHQEILDATVARAFGERLLTPHGVVEPAPDWQGIQLRYEIATEDGPRRLILDGRSLEVSDVALDPDHPGSLISVIRTFDPNAILSMGVTGSASFKAEVHADSGGLILEPEYAQAGGHEPEVSLGTNYSLARAVLAGASELS